VDVAQRLAEVRAAIAEACERAGRSPDAVQLLAVSKRQSLDKIRAAMALGQMDFGESRVQELVAKAHEMQGSGVRWHMIGSLQTNKVRDLLAVPDVALLHSLDRWRLAAALERELASQDRQLDVLLQLNAAREEQKHGVAPEDAEAFLRDAMAQCPHLRVRGIMAMGPLTGDAKPVFEECARVRAALQAAVGLELPVLSLGMTGDLAEAAAAGSTMVRIGTGVFGPREDS